VLAHLFSGELLRHGCGLLSARASRQGLVDDRDYSVDLGIGVIFTDANKDV
jgi:hypothetical protein